MQKYRKDVLSVGLLAVLSLVYCHRFYGVNFHLEGDGVYYLYYLLHSDLYQIGHNPFQWDYSSLMLWAKNPTLSLVEGLVKLLSSKNAIEKAFLVVTLTAWLNSWLISVGAYSFFRFVSLSRIASLVAAILVTFTGLHLNSIREFNFNFQISLMCVGPLLIALFKIPRTLKVLNWTLVAGLFIGFSLLGGSNVPLFYYLPFCFVIPLFFERKLKSLLRVYFAYLAACAIGFVIATEKMVPGILSLEDSNRVNVALDNILHSVPPLEKLAIFFLRDWWIVRGGNFHEQDYFLGLPALVLFSLGVVAFFRTKSNRLVEYLLFIFLFISGVVTHYCFLPDWIASPISRFYALFSMRNSNRFFLLALYPVAYFVGRGMDALNKKNFSIACLVGLFIQSLLLLNFLEPVWPLALADTQWAATLSLIAGLVACGSLWVWTSFRKFAPLVICTFFSVFYFAPIQLTGYSDFYRLNREVYQTLPPSRLDFANLLGLRWNYSQAYQEIENVFFHAPGYLQAKETLQGRILDLNHSDGVRLGHFNAFAGHTKHKFAFSQFDLHTSPRRLSELYQSRTESILNLAGVCWLLPKEEFGTRFPKDDPRFHYLSTGPLIKRSDCLPEAFLVSGMVPLPDDNSVLSWMHLPENWKEVAGVNCSQENCEPLPKATTGEVGKILSQHAEPGEFSFATQTTKPSLLFLSTPYHAGWRAWIDGSEVKVLRANHAYMALSLSEGNHKIKMRYTDRLIAICHQVSLWSLFGVIGFLIFRNRRFRIV